MQRALALRTNELFQDKMAFNFQNEENLKVASRKERLRYQVFSLLMNSGFAGCLSATLGKNKSLPPDTGNYKPEVRTTPTLEVS